MEGVYVLFKMGMTIVMVMIIFNLIRSTQNRNRKEHDQKKTVRTMTAPSGRTVTVQKTAAPTGAVIGGVVDTDGDGEISTTEYLAQKAREDEREHAMDDYRTRKTITENGRIRLASMIPDDGTVPSGCRIRICGYCGAENVLKNSDYAPDFQCYFCHTPLE